MDLKNLQASGAFVTRTLFKRELPLRRPLLKPAEEWADPEVPEESGEIVDDSVTVHIRKRSSADFLELVGATDRDRAHVAILRCVCHADGSEVFESLEQAKQLKEWLFIPLMQAVNEVNGHQIKNSQPRTSSGAKSRSLSAAARSPSGNKRFQKKSAPSGASTGPSAAP